MCNMGGLISVSMAITKGDDEVCGIQGHPGPTKVWMEMPTCMPKGQESGSLGALVMAWGMGSPRHCWGATMDTWGHWMSLGLRAWPKCPPPATRALKGGGSSLQKGPRMFRSGPNSR